MLTDKELAKLKVLAIKAQPFPDNYGTDFKYDEKEYEERKLNNGRFIVAAKNFVPDLIDELLAYRNGELEEDDFEEYEESEADMMTIYEGEVHIVNNYITNYVDMESIEELIVKKLNEGNKPMKACCNE